MTDLELRLRLTEGQALAATMFGEGAGLPVEGRLAVGSVVRNRLVVPNRFGGRWRDVCHQRAQFSCWWKFGGVENHARLMKLCAALVTHGDLDGVLTPTERAIWGECLFLAEGFIAGRLRDRVHGATHYFNPDAMVPAGSAPAWAVGAPICVVGDRPQQHRFYRA